MNLARRPVRKPPHQGGGFVASEMPAERRVMRFSDNALAETAPAWDAQAIRLALTSSMEQATTHKEGAPLKMGAKNWSVSISCFHEAINSGAIKCRSG